MRIRRPGKSLLDDPVWIELLERYVRGETTAALSREYKVSVSAINWQARNRGYRKMDRPDAVYRWHRPPPITAQPDRLETLAFEDDPDDPEGSAARALSLASRAAREGRLADHAQLSQSARSILRTGRLRRRGAGSPSPSWGGTTAQRSGWGSVGRPHPASADASASFPTSGEGAAALVLRPSQRAPEGDWSTWLFLGGRGAGKTLAGASWLADQALTCGRLALVGATLHDVREVMIGGPSGILSLPRWRKANGGWDGPVYEPSRRRLRFPNGAEAWVFSAEDPDSLRGPQFAAAWADEFCAWGGGGRGPAHRGGGETLALLRMGLRMTGAAGARPRLVVTTTPRPIKALRELRAEPGCVETHAPTAENAAWLAPEFLAGLAALYGGTRRAAQELEGLVVEIEGGLFTAAMLAAARGAGADGGSSRARRGGPYDRVVVGVDPTATTTGDACGIVVAGRRRRADGTREAWVLADRSAAGLTPEGWARRALAAARDFAADAIVAEVNQGGDMVKAVFRAAQGWSGGSGEGPPLRTVRAAEGKRARAEPVAALYEQGRVRHAAPFPRLEEELMALGGEDEGRMSLDRADALVWAVSALMLNGDGQGPSFRVL